MSVQLLDKTRKINKLLHNNNSSKVVFNDICDVLTDILDSNVLVVSKKGKGCCQKDFCGRIHRWQCLRSLLGNGCCDTSDR